MKYGVVYTTFPYCAVVGYGVCEIRVVDRSSGLRGGVERYDFCEEVEEGICFLYCAPFGLG